ncbi:interleukin-15 [Electrophorus electricus]|uniref:interleukin-15 n=1 Tax=Electrophorus electricus TaxID=8005 RepID=UPI0015CFE333|nr:interleukin-15 [Electrophorus electricus]
MKTLLIRFLILAFGVWNKSPKHRSKRTLRCVCVLWCFDSNLECHLKFEVWNSFLILSCLSVMLTSVHAHDKQSLIELQDLLKRNKPKIINSDALLYTPPANVNSCTRSLMYCYLLELNVVFHEMDFYRDPNNTPVYYMKENYSSLIYECQEKLCQQCEEYPQRNTTEFCEKMEEFILKLLNRVPYRLHQNQGMTDPLKASYVSLDHQAVIQSEKNMISLLMQHGIQDRTFLNGHLN